MVWNTTYMAPEVWENYTRYTFSADIWSLGCIMAFQCNKGKHLIQGCRTMPEMIQKMREWRVACTKKKKV